MVEHAIGTTEEHQRAREELLALEKEITHRSDEAARKRRALPWVKVEKDYEFETDDGTKTLPELFDGRSQLLMYHFMFGPEYTAGCRVCSSGADTWDGAVPHLNARDVTMIACSRGPLQRLLAYRQRMGWSFPWVSSAGTDFSADYGAAAPAEEVEQWIAAGLPPAVEQTAEASGADLAGYLTERPGLSAFALDGGDVYHTYSSSNRGLEVMLAYYPLLDRVPKGRDEPDDMPSWIRHHDEY